MDEQTNKGFLNLDEMLGDQKLKVRYQGREYPIRSMGSLSPDEFAQVMAYGKKFQTLGEADIESDGGASVMKAIDDVIEIIAPALPRHALTLKERLSRGYKRRFALSLEEATAVMQFWIENNQSKNGRGAGIRKPRTRSR